MPANDEALLKAIASKDETTLQAFMVSNFKGLLSFIVTNGGTHEDAEDIMQDAMMVIYQLARKDSKIIEKSITDYFYGICKNLWYQKVKKKKYIDNNTSTDEMITSTIQDDYEITHEINALERYQLYEKYLAELSGDCKAIFAEISKGITLPEIAKKKKWSLKYIYKLKSNCKKELMERIKKDPRYSELKFE